MNVKNLMKAIQTVCSVSAAGFISFIAFMFSIWPINDDELPNMTTISWLEGAITRVAVFTTVGLVAGFIMYHLNRFIYIGITKDKESKFPFYLSIISTSIIIIAALVSGITYWVEKPYM